MTNNITGESHGKRSQKWLEAVRRKKKEKGKNDLKIWSLDHSRVRVPLRGSGALTREESLEAVSLHFLTLRLGYHQGKKSGL